MAHVHLIGIGGSGLSAIARLLLERGEIVSGSDWQDSPPAETLRRLGARIYVGHRAENILGAQVVVRSSAVREDNVEVQAALAANIPVLKRAEFLRSLTGNARVLAVAGTHGKTTTTSMLAWALTQAGLDPSYIIGSVAGNLNSNAHAGKGGYFVIEADEYDRMFLGLEPFVAVVTNIEHDHPDCFPTQQAFYQVFQEFTQRMAPDGTLLVCQDDPAAHALGKEALAGGKQVAFYAIHHWLGQSDADYKGSNLRPNENGGYDFEFIPPGSEPQTVSLLTPGIHNVANAVAALAVAHMLGAPLDKAIQALQEFRGSARRFDVRGEAGGVLVIDDYAHHPTEIRATLAAAKVRYPDRPLWAVWQPHTYSRIRALLAEFAKAFGEADHVLVAPIYAAREQAPLDGFSHHQAAAAIDQVRAREKASPAHRFDSLEEIVAYLLEHAPSGAVVLVLSAGDADQMSARYFEQLQQRAAQQPA